jgi:crotonobetainyl-CoA:carnitine CoA-transferase CaiB-like acyl-CoA transferase
MSGRTADDGRLPLDDVRILAIEQYGAGPWATRQLADLGADVVKIEDPRTNGDVGRYVPPFQVDEDSLFFETFNSGKRSIELDLSSAGGREVFLRLVRGSDAVFSNLRGDLPAKLGLRFQDLAPHNPRIVCCSLTGYGQYGPRAASGALDYVIQGLAGWMAITGEPDSPPTRSGASLVDYAGGYVAAIALLGGLWRARRDGIGCDCDISLQETALSLLTYVGTWAATREYVPARLANSAHPSLVPFQMFATADEWIVVACPKQNLWEKLCKAIDREDLSADAAYRDLAARERNREPLIGELAATFRTRSASEWISILDAAGVPVGPVNTIDQALRDKQIEARDGIDRYTHEVLGDVAQVRSPLRLSGPRNRPSRAPRLGEHTSEVLAGVGGIGSEEANGFAARGAFGRDSTLSGIPVAQSDARDRGSP